MITDGRLIVLLPKTPSLLNPSDDLAKTRSDSSLRQYFGIIAQVTLEETVHDHAKDRNNNHTIVVVERGFFAYEKERANFKKKLEESGVASDHVLFGEDYASGYHHMVLKIHELCGS